MKLSVNQATVKRASVPEVVDACARHGVEGVGLWREPVHEHGVERTAALVRQAGLTVSSLCRGGFFTGADQRLDDNRRAIDEAAALGAQCLVLVPGGVQGRDLAGARDRVAGALEVLAPHAADAGVRLALEPMHPVFCADRGVVSTLAQALELAAPHAAVGVVVDALHVWWDPALAASVAAAGADILSYQVCDWVTPLPADVLLGRGLPGDGHIDLVGLTSLVRAAGYAGFVEVEVFNEAVWELPADRVVAELVKRHATGWGPVVDGGHDRLPATPWRDDPSPTGDRPAPRRARGGPGPRRSPL
ncbi:sugar phosphate isomerase/epimerase family protein [Saccharothrix syringae]|uniref:Sugar phosphate isomerase/epimerase n=1 Tax=Saccharothrix syringae TaxID=103733 RepID=A0A5Q0H7K4_SACSY|nr:sugar phosphate isomerase/epimerase family protein [Saccharothrix syringae]QFZ22228.1 sugar phosphate isomerase/epimerase [Saccharothrix syringae]